MKWKVFALTTLCAGFLTLAVVELFVLAEATKADTPGLDYIIILGAKVQSDGPSLTLRRRLDRAVAYHQESPDAVFVLSGGKGDDEPMAEAEAMFLYLVGKGVPPGQLLMETRSTNTTQNITYSKTVIEADVARRRADRQAEKPMVAPGPYMVAEEKPMLIGVLTSNYHLFRATRIAQKQGLPEVGHVASTTDGWLLPGFCLREGLAVLKDKFWGHM
ncbi:MAG: YdcF family protein [Lachnospiraceae bacterium]|nr:YdcF family protein [Lachnospiraceae bacterium]